MKIKPLHDRVVVKAEDLETRSPGGIFIPDNAKEKPTTGTVLAAGPGKRNERGELLAMTVPVGSRVIFGQFAGQKVKIDNEEVTILREEDIFGIIE
jgi:chaperonin GroES